MKLYVGNLSYQVTEDDLKVSFEGFGNVETVVIIKDRETGRSKGFGFVEMSSKEEGQAAIEGLNGKDLSGRNINVNEARPSEPRGGKGGFGGNKGGFGSGGGWKGGYGGGKPGFNSKKGGFGGGNRGGRTGIRGDR
ncbi:RNA-binding protein [Candidatus Desantisbacteria bacterium]|nr:RNA-binding protein [Candidatus Desantisbacteria bacterium]